MGRQPELPAGHRAAGWGGTQDGWIGNEKVQDRVRRTQDSGALSELVRLCDK